VEEKHRAFSAAVSITGLVKNYGSVKALRGLDLTIETGQIFCLLGPNGAGKSTLIKAMVGAVRPTSGTVEVLRHSMPGESRLARARLGYMPQVPALYEDLSVRANVKFFGRSHGAEGLEERIDRVLDFVGLLSLSTRRTGTLSGGLKQRCSLACALVHEPELLFLDEPTAGVDPVLKEGFWKYFRSLTEAGVTIVISTHLMDEPLTCDRIGILREGLMILEDTPDNIMAMGKTEVCFDVNGKPFTARVGDYSRELPEILKRYGLDPHISKISLHEEKLEDILLRIIKERKGHAE
jgi:ABC-2 type transport system ATP-binding protein